ncbi:formin-binding protein [Stygiomarasmius scandens]|uniref:Formin-binding protein n=1 Tax=Marasmiellus scandens TaxID=2682957 RepID=A0ABR1K6E4_9AGAR
MSGVRSQPSVSSLSKYAVAKSPGVDPYNGIPSRDFCNSFWGIGDAGVNILFARMRGAARTTDSLREFWKERAVIEEEYGKRLLELAKMTVGKDEIGELRNVLDTLQLETEKLGKSHLGLASQISSEIEEPTKTLLNKQLEHRKSIQSPVEKKFKTKVAQEGHVSRAREKCQSDRVRMASYAQQIENNAPESERIRQRLKRAEQTAAANENDYRNFCKTLADMLPGWENDWKDYCDSCQDLEEERLDFMKDNLWAYANAVSTVCVNDDNSCEIIRTVLDHFESDRDLEAFVQEYGTGNSVPNAPDLGIPDVQASSSSTSLPTDGAPAVTTHIARHVRKARKALYAPPVEEPVVKQPPPPPETRAPESPVTRATGIIPGPIQDPIPPPPPPVEPTRSVQQDRPVSTLPQPPQNPPHMPANENVPQPGEQTGGTGKKILFYVEAMYDYTATIDEEFSFQAGDIIAVTDIPDDGWWSGELLDEARREPGRHVFPSNFVRLF